MLMQLLSVHIGLTVCTEYVWHEEDELHQGCSQLPDEAPTDARGGSDRRRMSVVSRIRNSPMHRPADGSSLPRLMRTLGTSPHYDDLAALLLEMLACNGSPKMRHSASPTRYSATADEKGGMGEAFPLLVR